MKNFNFKKFFFNKFVIAIIINLILIIIASSLVAVNQVFYGVTAILTCVLCFIIALMYVVQYNKYKNNNNSELVPLTESQLSKFNKERANAKRFVLIKIISFIVIGLTLFLFAIRIL